MEAQKLSLLVQNIKIETFSTHGSKIFGAMEIISRRAEVDVEELEHNHVSRLTDSPAFAFFLAAIADSENDRGIYRRNLTIQQYSPDLASDNMVHCRRTCKVMPLVLTLFFLSI